MEEKINTKKINTKKIEKIKIRIQIRTKIKKYNKLKYVLTSDHRATKHGIPDTLCNEIYR